MSKKPVTTSESVYNIRHQVNSAYKYLHGRISKSSIKNHYSKKDDLLFKKYKKKLQRDIKKLSSSQHKIVTASKYGSCLVNASAGSGKTRVLVTRIAYLCIHEHVQPKKILAVTFTNNAVDQIRSRCKDLMGKMLSDQLHICTFHSFASKILRHFHSFSSWALCSDHHAKSIVMYWLIRYLEEGNYSYEQAVKDINKKDIGPIITKIGKGINYLKPQNNFGSTKEPYLNYIYPHFIEALNYTHEYSFSYMLYEAVHLLHDNPSYVKKLQSKYHYALIDEFQDTSLAEYKLLYPIFHGVKDHYVMAVGDPHQRIYDFAGADGQLPGQLVQDYHIIHQYFMEENFRSTRNIVKAGNVINRKNKARKRAITNNNIGNPVGIYKFKSIKQEAKVLADYIRASHLYNPTNKGSESKIAILAPYKNPLTQLQKGLVANHIRCFVVTTGSLVSGQCIAMLFDCLYMIHSKSDIYSSMDFISHATNMGIGKKTAHKWFKTAYDCNTNNIFDSQVIKEFMTFASKKAQKTVKYLITCLNKWKDYAQRVPIESLIKQMLKGLKSYMPKPRSNDQLDNNLKTLLTMCKLFQDDHKPNKHSVEEFLNFFAQQYETTRDKGKGIPLETIHSSKGGQWNLVFLVGIEQTNDGRGFPSERMRKDFKAKQVGYNEMYVAVTRAKRHLCICAANLPYAPVKMSSFANDINNELEPEGASKFYKM